MKPKQRRFSLWLLGAFVLVLLTFLILLQSSNLWKDFSVETASDTLLLYGLSSLNFAAFVIFGFIFLRSIIKLLRERRTLELGSRIKTRLLLYFAAISLLPIIAMAGFSYLFMNRALERWFSQIPENVVRAAGKVQKKANADQSAKLRDAAKMLASSLESREFSAADLQSIAIAGNLSRIEILSQNYETVQFADNQADAAYRKELYKDLEAARQEKFSGQSLQDGSGFDAGIAEFSDGRKLLIVSGLQADESVIQLVDKSLAELEALKAKQLTIRQIGLLTLGVLTFLLIFASSWTAFYIARGLTVPLKALAEGADEIAQGNLSHRVDVYAEDELALLVTTFNQMSSKLEDNSTELNQRKRYIETVLQSLPTGVISFDQENRVSTINRAAVNILSLDASDWTGSDLNKLLNDENRAILERLIARAKRIGHASEQAVLHPNTVNGGGESEANIPVALTASALGDQNGAVLVIEDLSELIAAQRASAWQEVARRMAHEIKNPLTPIQLSAERIAKRFSEFKSESGEISPPAREGVAAVSVDGMVGAGFPAGNGNENADDSTAEVIRDGTATILREVNSLKSMVDEFSRFARLPDANLEPGSINEIISQVVTLYEGRRGEARIETELTENLPAAMIDAEQLKRVFVNVIENAIEAFKETQEEKIVIVRTRNETARDLIVVEIADNGVGIPPSDFQKLFQPYFSTKGRGTGLGLAIVNRIITEHHGKIKVVSNQPKGAKFIIELPVAA